MKARQSILLMALLPVFATPSLANDFPTVERVQFVMDCMRDHPGPAFEMLNKCSCTIDRLAKKYRYNAFVEAQTLSKGVTIAGERGAELRDNEDAQKGARQYRANVKDAKQACFINN